MEVDGEGFAPISGRDWHHSLDYEMYNPTRY